MKLATQKDVSQENKPEFEELKGNSQGKLTSLILKSTGPINSKTLL